MKDLIAHLGGQGDAKRDPAIKLDVKPDGSLEISLGSFTRPGLYSTLTVDGAYKMTQRELLKAAGIVVARLADYQGRQFLDNHDIEHTMLSVLEAVDKIMADGTPRVWVNKREFEPYKKGTVETLKIHNPERPNWT